MSIVTAKVRSAKLYRYCLPMDSGVIVRNQRLSHREGYIVELRQGDKVAYGECAPLPGFSQESMDQVELELVESLQHWHNSGEWKHWDTMSPSVALALSMAQYELDGLLPKQGEYHVAPLCSGDPDELLPVFEVMAEGDRDKVAKVKVGLYEPIRDGMLVNLFLESIPDLKLRLDANRSWTLEKALKFSQYVSEDYRQRITFIEEPCRTPELSREFAEKTNINIAWDETVQEVDFNDNGFEHSALLGNQVTAIVIKPTLIGSVDRCLSLIDFAHQNGLQAVISSSIESTIGLTQLARLSAWKTPKQTPGLDTLQLFQCQLEVPWPNSLLPVVKLEAQSLVEHFG